MHCSLKVSRRAPFFTNGNSALQPRMFQNNRNTRTRSEISSKLTMSVFIVNFEHNSHHVLVFALLTLNSELPPRIQLLQSQGQQNNTFIFHKSQQCVAVQDVLEEQKHKSKCQISPKLIIGVFIVNFEHILHLISIFALLTLNSQMLAWILLVQSQIEQISTFIFHKLQQCCLLRCFKRICIGCIQTRQLAYESSH